MEPHPLCHVAIGSLLAQLDTQVVGAATSPCKTLALLEEHSPNVLVAELDLPEGRKKALEVISRGRRANPALVVIILSGSDDADLIDAAFDAGASAYILKTTEPEAVATAIQQAFEPSIYLARPRETRVAATTVDRVVPQLTRRELEILQLVSEGRSNRQVGQLLWVTDQTVKFHLANIYRKLGVGSRYDAARWAHEHGVLEVVESGEVVTIGEDSGNGGGNGNATLQATPLPVRRGSTRGTAMDQLREGNSR